MPQPKRIEGWAVPVEIAARSAVATDQRRKFKMVAYTGEPLDLQGFELPVVIDCATLDTTAQKLPALLDHMAWESSIVGQIESVRVEGANGQAPPLVAEGYFTPTDDPRDAGSFVLKKADAGFRWQASVGGNPTTVDKVAAGETVAVNGRTYAGPVLVARGVVLREISFVVLGADRRTSAVLARRRIKGAAMDFATWVASLGFTEADLTDQQRAALQIAFNEKYPAEEETPATNAEGETPPEEEPVTAEGEAETEEEEPVPTNAAARTPRINAGRQRSDAVAEENRRIAANRARVARIDAICAGAGNPEISVTERGRTRRVSLNAHAIANNWSAQRTELEALRASRGSGPALITKSHDKTCTVQAMQGAFILRAGGRLDHPAYQSPRAQFLGIPSWLRAGINDAGRNQIMDAAHRYADMSAVDLCREACRIDGVNPGHGRAEVIKAAFSGGSLSNVFTTNVNAVLLTSYMEAPDTTAGWVTETDVADFKTQERPRVEVGPGLAKLPRGGEADHASYEDNVESYKIARYAKQFVVDEQDVIDDSLGALSDVPRKFGMAAARLRPDLVYAILLANPTLTATARELFNSTDANLGTTAALSAANLRAGIAAMNNVRENEVNLNLQPTHLIVPPSLRFLAKELIASATIVLAGTDSPSAAERGSMNVLTDEGLTLVSDSRLENGVTDPASGTAYSGSTSTWFLGSVMAHMIEVGYLRGTGRAPRVRSGNLDKGQYGMWWDVSMDLGAKALDWKGLRKHTA